jgi:hypothetical protein
MWRRYQSEEDGYRSKLGPFPGGLQVYYGEKACFGASSGVRPCVAMHDTTVVRCWSLDDSCYNPSRCQIVEVEVHSHYMACVESRDEAFAAGVPCLDSLGRKIVSLG